MGFEKKGLKFPSAGPGSQVRVNYKQFQYIPYVPPILDQLLDLISLARINIWAQIRILWPMRHGKLPTSILKVGIFYCKKSKYEGFCLLYSGTWVHKRVRVKFKVPEYESRFPSTGLLQVEIYLGPGSRVRVQVPEYGCRFLSMDFEKMIEITSFLQIS